MTLNITAVNDGPVLDLDGSAGGTGYATTFNENGAAVRIADSDLVLSDDSSVLTSATVTLTNWKAGDSFAIGSIPAGITYSFSGPNNNILTLSGSASTTDYRVALRAITFSNSSDNPDTTARTVDIVVNDGLLTSTATATIAVTAVNDAPVLDLDGSASGTGYSTAYLTTTDIPVAIADVDRLITDPDSTTLVSATVQITAGLLPADSLAFTNVPATMGNITAGAYSSGTGLITLTSAGGTATLAQWQAALSAVNFATTSNTAGSRTVTVIVNDGALSSTAATTTISVVNSGNPTVAAASATGLEDAVAGIPITLAASDPDGTISSFTLSSLPTGGTLYTDAAMTQVAAISTAYAASANSLTLYFRPTTNLHGSPTFNFIATDNAANNSASAVATINVTAVADTPTLSVVNSLTQVFSTNWESVGALTPTANDTNEVGHAKGAGPIEGWSLTTPILAGAGGVADTTGTDQFYFNGDGDQITNSNNSTLYTAAGMLGSTTGADGQRVFLHLDNAANAGGYETPAITRTFTVTSTNQVYQLALNYAPDAAPTTNTGFEVLIDGVVVGTYVSTTSAGNSSLAWQSVHLSSSLMGAR